MWVPGVRSPVFRTRDLKSFSIKNICPHGGDQVELDEVACVTSLDFRAAIELIDQERKTQVYDERPAFFLRRLQEAAPGPFDHVSVTVQKRDLEVPVPVSEPAPAAEDRRDDEEAGRPHDQMGGFRIFEVKPKRTRSYVGSKEEVPLRADLDDAPGNGPGLPGLQEGAGFGMHFGPFGRGERRPSLGILTLK
jgi:hypothetical protein